MKGAGVTVYLETLNYLGEVSDSAVVAEFRNSAWADMFIPSLPNLGEHSRYKIVEIGDRVKYIKGQRAW